MLSDKPVEEFDAEELKEWEKDPRGAPFWAELGRMFQYRVSGIRAALHSTDGQHTAVILAGQLEAIEEIMQLPSVLIQQQADDKADKEEES